MPALAECVLVLAHGAGSSSAFLRRALPAERLGVRECRYVDDRTGLVAAVRDQLGRAMDRSLPVILGGVSLGAHASIGMLAAPRLPRNVVAGLAVMPAWTGAPDRVAAMTAGAAEAVAALTPAGVLAELDPSDWVTPLLHESWELRRPADLVAELETAAQQPAPRPDDLAAIGVPVGIVALRDDPLHPTSVARRWRDTIPCAALVDIGRDEPGADLAVFAERARESLALAAGLRADARV